MSVEDRKLFDLIRPPIIEYDEYKESAAEFVYDTSRCNTYPKALGKYEWLPLELPVKVSELKKLAKANSIKDYQTMKKRN